MIRCPGYKYPILSAIRPLLRRPWLRQQHTQVAAALRVFFGQVYKNCDSEVLLFSVNCYSVCIIWQRRSSSEAVTTTAAAASSGGGGSSFPAHPAHRSTINIATATTLLTCYCILHAILISPALVYCWTGLRYFGY